MARVDRVVLKDIVPHWLFGVGLFAALLMAATYLGRVMGFIVDGVPPLMVMELFGLLMMPILTKTFAMSVLLATLLGFGRLSADSEIVALRAAGASIYRIVWPVFLFSLAMAILTFAFNEKLVPVTETRYRTLAATLVKSAKPKDPKPFTQTFVADRKLRAAVVAQSVNPATQEFRGVTVIAYDDQGARSFVMFADRLEFSADATALLLDPGNYINRALSHWRVSGHVRVISPDLATVIKPGDDVWPSEMPLINQNFSQFNASRDVDPDSFTMQSLREFILFHRKQGDMEPQMLHNYEYGYWNKIAVPLAALMFGVLGAVLGIRSHRTGTASGYGQAIGITFLFVMLANLMNIWAEGGVIPAWSAAFTPLVIGSIAAGVIMWRRNG